MKKTKKFLSVFAVVFALVFALSVCFFAACGSDDDGDKDGDTGTSQDGGTSGGTTGDTGAGHTHDWDEGKVTTEPTCTAEGEMTYTCSGCDETKTETIDALGHDWVAGTAVDATCTAAGYTPYSCSRCDATKEDDPVDALGHSYGDPTFDKTAEKWVTACARGDSSIELTSGEGFTFEVETEAELTAAALLDGAEIVLADDITASIIVDGTVSLDLAGYTLTNLSDEDEIDATASSHTITVADGGILTIADSGHVDEDEATVYGTVDSTADGCAALYVEVGGEAVLNGGTYTRSLEDDDENTYYTVVNQGTMTINAGVTIETDAETESTTVLNGWEESRNDFEDYPEYDPLDDNEGDTGVDTAVMTINGGTFESAGDVLVENAVNGELVITGGDFTGNGDDAVIQNINELEIRGGTFTQGIRIDEDGDYYAGHYILWNYQGDLNESCPVAEVSGGTFTGGWDVTVYNAVKGTLTISGGTFDSDFEDSIIVYSDGTLVITGGTFTSSVCEEEDEPEIWIVWVSEGTAEIYNGTFTAGNASDVVIEADEETSTVIYGGTFDGVEDSSIFEFDDGAKLTIYGGTFGSVERPTVFDFDEVEVAIYGGTFYEDPSDYVAEGYVAIGYDEDCSVTEDEDNIAYYTVEFDTSIYAVYLDFTKDNASEYLAGTWDGDELKVDEEGIFIIHDNNSSKKYEIKNGGLNFGGKFTANVYVKLDLSSFIGQEITISCDVFCNDSSNALNAYIATTAKETLSDGDAVATLNLAKKGEEDDSGTLTYTFTVTEDDSTLYLLCDNKVVMTVFSIFVNEAE